jgi:hypothetical protein
MLNVLIFGSCVSRDILNLDVDGRIRLVDYYARSSFASALCPHRRTDDLTHLIESPFQRRMVRADLERSFREQLCHFSYDVLLIDFIDERFDLFVDERGSILTLSNEFLSTGFTPGNNRGALVRSGSSQFFDLWQSGWSAFIAIIDSLGQRHRIRINKVFWSLQTSSGDSDFQGCSARGIADANAFLARLYDRVRADLPDTQFIDFPPSCLVACENHRWGISPFHYVDAYYELALRQILASCPSQCEPNESAEAETAATGQLLSLAAPAAREVGNAMQARGFGGPLLVTAASGERSSELTPNLTSLPASGDYRTQGQSKPLIIAERTLTKFPIYVTWQTKPGAIVHVEVELFCADQVKDRQALLTFDFGSHCEPDLSALGLARSSDPQVGLYRYLDTRPGLSRTTFSLPIPHGCRAVMIGARTWYASDEISLKSLVVSHSRKPEDKPLTLVSVDVEALPGRAESEMVDRLIYGIFGHGRYGIELLCDIFAEYGVRATFFVDYATCCLHGEKGIYQAAELLLERGHDVQLHMHSEVLVRHFDWAHDRSKFPGFENLSYSTTAQVIEYGVRKFRENLGYSPRIFRPGGMKKGLNTYAACKALGFEAVSAAYRHYDPAQWAVAERDGLYLWENGLVEIPLDIALDPLVRWTPFETTVKKLFATKKRKLVSLLLHSTSLLYRERTHDARFLRYEEGYEQTLREYLEWVGTISRFATHADVLGFRGDPSLPKVTFAFAGYEDEAAATARQYPA